MRILDELNFNFNETTLIFIGVSVFFILLLILILLIGKKAGKGKKVVAGLLIAFASLSLVVTTLVNYNVIPLALRVGYFIEVNDADNDGKISGYKVTMEGKFSYYEDTQKDLMPTQEYTYKGKIRLEGKFVTFYKDNNEKTFEISDFGSKLKVNGETAYVFYKTIELRRNEYK